MRATLFTLSLGMALAGACQPASAPLPPTPPPANPPLHPRCVHFKDLRDFIPAALDGFKQVKEEGSTGKYGDVQVSEAKRTFAQEEGREVSVRIVDTTMAEELGRAIKAAAEEAADRPETDPSRPLFLSDAVGFVRWDPSRSDPDEARAEATLWVGGRFVVAVSSQGFDGTSEVRGVARALDLAGLSKLRLDATRRVH